MLKRKKHDVVLEFSKCELHKLIKKLLLYYAVADWADITVIRYMTLEKTVSDKSNLFQIDIICRNLNTVGPR